MKKLFLTSIIGVFFSIGLFAQPWLNNLPKKDRADITFLDYQNAFNEYWKSFDVKGGWYINEKGEKQKAYGWKQFKRWENFWQDRVNRPDGSFPNTTAGAEYKKYIAKNGQYREDEANWSCLGANSSEGGYAGIGRINTIAFHPTDLQTYWIGAPAGGIWVTTDGGDSWTVLSDNNDVLGVSAIVIPSDYETSNTIYIGTGDRDAKDNYSVGVLKSTDQGQTWQTTGLVFEPKDKHLVNNMRLHPENDNIIFAATTDGLYKTTDGGENWTNIYSAEFIDIEFCPNHPDTIYGATRNGSIYRTTDGGDAWLAKYEPLGVKRVELAVTPADEAVVYALGSNYDNGLKGIYKSTDYGESFSKIYDDKNLLGWESSGYDEGGQGWYDLSMAADLENADIVYVGGVNTWMSEDGGSSWELANHWIGNGAQAVHADKHYLAYRPNDNMLFETNDGGVYSYTSADGWVDHTNGIVISQIYGLSTSQNSADNTVLGLQDNGTKLRLDGVWYDVLGGDGMKCLVDYTNDEVQYGSLYYGQIRRTNNTWDSYVNISENIGGSDKGAWVTPYVLDPQDHNTIYIGYSNLWKSNDQGETFESIGDFGGKIRSIAVAPTNSDCIYIATSSSLYKTIDGGNDWISITSGLNLDDYRVTDIEVKQNDPKTVWVTISGFNSNSVRETRDGGQSWTNISEGLPEVPANCIIQNRLENTVEHLYVGTDFGVFFKNGDENWTLFSNGLPNVVVTEMDFHYDYSNPEATRLRASTYGRGLWETKPVLTGNFAPYVITQNVTSITSSSAVLAGEVGNNFNADVTECGFVLSTTPSPTIDAEGAIKVVTDSPVSSGEFSATVENLTSGTMYYYRSYAKNNNGMGYGADKIFSTKCTKTSEFPWIEDCEKEGLFPPCFTIENVEGDFDWVLEHGSSENMPQSPHSGDYNFEIYTNFQTGTTRLVLPIFDLTNLPDAKLQFWFCLPIFFGVTDELAIYYKNGAEDWTFIERLEGEGYVDWTKYEVELPNPGGEYQIALEAKLKEGGGIIVDDIKINDVLSIDENKSEELKIFPNPTSGIVNIVVDNPEDKQRGTVTDVTGKVLKEFSIKGKQTTIDLKKYPKGTYIINVYNEKGISTKRILLLP